MLWAYDVEDDQRSQLGTLEDHAGAMEYDHERDIIWVAGGVQVTGYSADDGSVVTSHREHTDELSALAVHGEYVATATTFGDEVIVYDVAEETVAFEPELPADVLGVGDLALTNDDELIVATDAEDNSYVAMFDLDTEDELLSYREHIFLPSSVEYVEEVDMIVTTGFDNHVLFYDVGAGAVVEQYPHDDTIYEGSLDRHNGLLWIGDGEPEEEGQPGDGTISGLDVATTLDLFDDEPDETDDADDTDAVDEEDADDNAVDDGDADDDGSGFSIIVGLAGVLGAVVITARVVGGR